MVITEDDGIRPGTSMADLAKLKTVFKKSGTTTAGTVGLLISLLWVGLLFGKECCRNMFQNTFYIVLGSFLFSYILILVTI